jgi:alkylation response protein AidB-like acyl-CoA dehydrogenase
MDFQLDDEQQLIVSTVRRFVDRELAGRAADADRAGAAPDRILAVAAELGLLLDAVPADADGLLEGPYSHLGRALRGLELGRGCAALGALFDSNVEPALAAGAWAGDAVSAELYGSLAGGGRAATAIDWWGRLEVEEVEGGLTVSGRLGPVPCLDGASHLLLCARTTGGRVAVLLEAAALEREPVVPSGWRAAAWANLTCDRLQVGADRILGRDPEVERILSWYRVGLAARAVGAAGAAIGHARGYADERVQFGQPIGTFESVAGMADRAETAIAAARLLTIEAAWKLDHDHPQAGDAASRARDFAARTLADAAIDAVQIYGGYGFVNDYPVEKIMRDARAFEVLGGNEALSRALAARPAA